MVTIIRERKFEKAFKRVKDSKLKERIVKKIEKIIKNPECGLFLNYRECERKIYIPPFRLIYSHDKSKNEIYLINFGKRDKIYKK